MRKIKVQKKPNFGIVIFIVLAAVTLVIFFLDGESKIKLTEIFALATAVAGIISFLIEMIRGKKLAEAEFIVNLNQIFTSNQDYLKAYTCFEEYDYENNPNIECLTNAIISNYLTFFETFYLLIQRNIVDIAMIDNLFGYRFFLAVHNPCVQARKLIKSPDNFHNIYKLEKIWIEYRKALGMPIFHEERSLKNLVPEDLYQRLVLKR
ncbi:MAG: hypothetical protein PHX62_07210 [Bacilli bacterium]|nr:hypothetical protein [Bacilli bacterium]